MALLTRLAKQPLATKLLVGTGTALLVCVMLLSAASIWYQQRHLEARLAASGARLGDTIRLGVRYAMMLNDREELAHIVQNLGNSSEIDLLHIYNKEGEVMFSSRQGEVGQRASPQEAPCQACHAASPPRSDLSLAQRTRLFTGHDGRQMLGVITPVMNEPSCSGPPCHFHPASQQVLGVLDVVIPFTASVQGIRSFQGTIFSFAALVLLMGGISVRWYLQRFLTAPIKQLIAGTRAVAMGEAPNLEQVQPQDEIGELAQSITTMYRRIAQAQANLHRQYDEYQRLFDQVPCAITVQDKNFKVLRSNRLFRERFHPKLGDHCYTAYKGRQTKCPNCAVEKTLLTGLAHCSEESTVAPDGSRLHWLVHTSPVLDTAGNAVAVMEMTQDITQRKNLEERLRCSELKYRAILNNIPTAVFVLDTASLEIIDCNTTAERMYATPRDVLVGSSFLDYFMEEERQQYASQLTTFTLIHRAYVHAHNGRIFPVDIFLSPSEYQEQAVFLLIANDITAHVEAEQKVVQAGKMAMLGEMATGVAHELNQPLTVIKSASGYLLRKTRKQEPVTPETLAQLMAEVDGQVDRATEIISHMRVFGRPTDIVLERVYVNEVITDACRFFNRQLAHRNIELVHELASDLPPIMAVPNRLEQVIINLMINARDAIEEQGKKQPNSPRRITLLTCFTDNVVEILVQDTGTGIAPARLPRLFEPFFTTKEAGKGTGLGLSISYGLVKEFGGTITAYNRQDEDPQAQGAVFCLRFPCTGGA